MRCWRCATEKKFWRGCGRHEITGYNRGLGSRERRAAEFFGLGGIAQLGERLHGMQEVSGSIPLTSTTSFRENGLFQGFDPIV